MSFQIEFFYLVPCAFHQGTEPYARRESRQHSAPVGNIGTAHHDGLARGDREGKGGRGEKARYEPCLSGLVLAYACRQRYAHVVARHHHVTFRTHAATVAEHGLRGEEVHALVPDHRSHGERSGKRDVHQGDNHAARVRDAALQPVHAHVRAEERYVVGGVHHHTHVGMDGVERGSCRHMDVNPDYHSDMTVRK